MTYFSSVTSKGTITVPAKVRKQLGIKPGIRVAIEINQKGNAEIIRPVDIEEVRRQNQEFMRKNKIKPVTDDQITKAWQDAAVERYKRSLE